MTTNRTTKVDALDDLKRLRDIAMLPKNAGYNKYMRGIANGLILAVATIEGNDAELIAAPNEPSAAKQAALINPDT